MKEDTRYLTQTPSWVPDGMHWIWIKQVFCIGTKSYHFMCTHFFLLQAHILHDHAVSGKETCIGTGGRRPIIMLLFYRCKSASPVDPSTFARNKLQQIVYQHFIRIETTFNVSCLRTEQHFIQTNHPRMRATRTCWKWSSGSGKDGNMNNNDRDRSITKLES